MRVLLYFFGVSILLGSCYEPKEGCLDLKATNFKADADNPCDDCCTYPTLTVAFQHQVVLPGQPDTVFAFRYETPYPSPLDTMHYFVVERSRYFISNIRLVKENGEEVGVEDTIRLEAPAGNQITVEDNFAKADRDIFQTSTIGTVLTSGTFKEVKFTLGLNETLLQTNPASVPSGHPLSGSDTLLYDTLTGYVSNLLIFRQDTFPGTAPLKFTLTEAFEITLPFEQPFEILEGFDIRLTLKVNYLYFFEEVDFINDSPETIRQKFIENLPKAFSVAKIELVPM